MKLISSFSARCGKALALFGIFSFGLTLPGGAVPITGGNGRVVDFAGIKSAGPGGLTVQVTSGGAPLEVGWDKLDLAKLKVEHPAIFEAYEAAKGGKVTELNLGTFAPAAMPAKAPAAEATKTPAAPVIGKEENQFSATVDGAQFTIQLLGNGEPKAVLLLAIGQDGRSDRYLGQANGGQWTEIARTFNLGVLAYRFPTPGDRNAGDMLKFAPFIEADKGSGDTLVKALVALAKESGRASLAAAPIAIYGQDAVGAAFAFNFSQAFPDRVIAAVVAKGAFYSVKPTEASAKVPLMMLSGEYDDDIKLWNPTNTHLEVYEANLGLKPNWVYAVEFRGTSGSTPASHHAAITFLDRMILARLADDGKLRDLDPARAFIGDLKESKIAIRADPSAAITVDQTWLPDGEIAQLWKDLYDGTLQPPAK